MLQTLKINNVALIKDLEIDFSKGFNVMLGSTGAGKSIIFDALNFVLGAKSDKTLIRSGERVMKVEALFSQLGKSENDALMALGIIDEEVDEILLSRSLDVDGKGSARINGSMANAALLKVCAGALVDSYSQHESVDLLKSKNHLTMLDRLAIGTLDKVKAELKNEYSRYQEILAKIAGLGGDEFERERTKSLLSFQIDEIEKASIEVGEMEQLAQKIQLMESAEKLFEAGRECENLLSGSSMSAIASVHEAEGLLAPLANISEIEDYRNRLASCKYELEDISYSLRDLCDNNTYSQVELDRLQRRKDELKLLCKKYGGSEEKVIEFLEQAKVRLDALTDSEAYLAKLEKEKLQSEKSLETLCAKLSQLRKQIAHEIESKMMSELSQLGMKSTTFVVEFNRGKIGENGFDEVEFAFSANKGQEVKALSKTASGGEMSRIMLAFKTIFAKVGSASTLIFDEIDTGISGEIGYVVGEKIAVLSKDNQVLCVTHLAQVACQGDAFYYVSKSTDDKTTYTNVRNLNGDEIEYELARMLGGDKVTDISLAHIKQMRLRAGK